MADITGMLQAAAGSAPPTFNPREYFNTVLYTGNGSTQSITGVGFEPDFVWLKERSVVRNHCLFDQVRGATELLSSSKTDAEATELNSLTSFDSDGFSLGNAVFVNESTETFVAWNWNAGGSNATNTDGTITSTVRANTTAGFSIVSWAGIGTPGNVNAEGTIGHGLGVAPAMIIVKSRTSSNAWIIYHESVGPTKFLAFTTAAASVNANVWRDTAPDSSVVTLGQSTGVAGSGKNFIAYCFAEIEGFSAFGSYTGNGSATGPSVTTDFQPTWLMIKRTNTTGDWILLDSARDATNPRTAYLEPNTFDAEATGNDVDFNSTGFQIKSTSASINASGANYIYACFA